MYHLTAKFLYIIVVLIRTSSALLQRQSRLTQLALGNSDALSPRGLGGPSTPGCLSLLKPCSSVMCYFLYPTMQDELHRMKSNGGIEGNSGSFATGWNPRRSLHLLKMSLGHPTTFQCIKEDSDEEMEIDENDVEKPYNHENMAMSSINVKESKRFQASMNVSAGTSQVEDLDRDKILISIKRSCCSANKFNTGTDVGDGKCKLNIAASIQRGLQVIESHQNNSAWKRASVGLNARIMDIQPCKVDVAIQTDPEEYETRDNPLALVPSCLLEASANESRDPSTCRDLQLVPVDVTVPSDDQKQRHFLKVSKPKEAWRMNLCIS